MFKKENKEPCGPLFHEGDYVVVRDWDDMAEEYGFDSSGNIMVPYSFVPDMKGMCGEYFQIKSATEDLHYKYGKFYRYKFMEPLRYKYGREYSISEQMLRPVNRDIYASADDILAVVTD